MYNIFDSELVFPLLYVKPIFENWHFCSTWESEIRLWNIENQWKLGKYSCFSLLSQKTLRISKNVWHNGGRAINFTLEHGPASQLPVSVLNFSEGFTDETECARSSFPCPSYKWKSTRFCPWDFVRENSGILLF